MASGRRACCRDKWSRHVLDPKQFIDRGDVGLQADRRMLVSEHFIGTHGFGEQVMAFHGERLRSPLSDNHLLVSKLINWYQKEVYRSPARDF